MAFSPCAGEVIFLVEISIGTFFMVLICVAFFFGHLSKVPSVLIGLKTPVLRGGILYPPTKFFDLKEGGYY